MILHTYDLLSSATFRIGVAFITSWIFSLIGGSWFMSHAKVFCARARNYTPSSHQAKNNTPTMGGLIIIGALIATSLIWSKITEPEVLIFFGCLLGFAAIGFWDDWSKILGNKGISESAKFKAQLLVGFAVVGSWYYFLHPSSVVCIPLIGCSAPLGLLLVPWACFIIVGTSNAVNLTDGLDGLAAELLIRNFAVFTFISYFIATHPRIAAHLSSGYMPSVEIAVVGAATVGACLGFLWYNVYPARCFMGDVGSLALGSVLALMALMVRQELLLAITGFIFVLETLSVFAQVGYYKSYGKRLFKMAPIHHHFELSGWHEVTVTGRFAILTSVLCAIAVMIFLFE